MRKNPENLNKVLSQIDGINLYLVDYTVLKDAMEVYASKEKSLSNLIHGVVEELNRRSLTVVPPNNSSKPKQLRGSA
jgi:hypothetical protein